MRKAFVKHIPDIEIQGAHGGAGRRQLLLSNIDDISSNLDAMTKGFLAPAGVFDWHGHKKIDEFFLVTKGTGIIEYEDGSVINYKPDDLIYSPSDQKHRIENNGSVENEFFFIRIKT